LDVTGSREEFLAAGWKAVADAKPVAN
jgi:hypothetical protein